MHKSLFSFLFAVLLPAIILSQVFLEKSFGEFHSVQIRDGMVDSQGGVILAGGKYYPTNAILIKVSPLGDTLKTFSFPSTGNYHHIIPARNGDFITSNAYIYCDFGGGADLQRFSPNLDSLWTVPYSVNGPIAELNDSILIGTNLGFKEVSLFNPDGTSYLNSFGFTYTSELLKLLSGKDQEFILLLENEIQSVVIDTFMNALTYTDTKYPFPGTLIDLESANDGGFWLAMDQSLYQLDSAFQPVDSILLSNTFLELTDICADFDGVWVYGKGAAKTPTLLRLDSNLTQSYQFSFSDSFAVPIKIIKRDSSIYCIGNEVLKKTKHGFVKEFDMNTGQTQNTSNDAGIISATIDSAILVPPTANFKLEAKVRNFGQDTLRSVDLTIHLSTGPACFAEFAYFHIDTLDIIPGASETIDLGWIFSHRMFYDFVTSMEICVYTSSPNRKIDDFHSNDTYCLPNLLIANEGQKIPEVAAIYPNPASDYFMLSIPQKYLNQPATFAILNAMGQVLQEGRVTETKTRIDFLPFLPQGVYLIRIFTENGNILSNALLKH